MKRTVWIVGAGLVVLLAAFAGMATDRLFRADKLGTAPSQLDENIFYVSIFALLFAVTGVIVWFLARLLRWQWPYLSLAFSLVLSHTCLLLICAALFPTGIFFAPPPVDDLYGGYFLFPGVHLYLLAGKIIEPLQPFVGRIMPDYWGAILDIVILPGLVCAILGGVQWYLIGKAVERFRTRRVAQAV